MDYFLVRQDKRVYDVAQPVSGSLNLHRITKEQFDALPPASTLLIQEGGRNEYPDYLENMGMLISGDLLRIMKKYQQDIEFKTVVLIEPKKNRLETYYLISVPQIPCAYLGTAENRRETMGKLILDEIKIGDAKVFGVASYENKLFVRLDVAESILRRGSYGVWFEKAQVIKKEAI